MASPAVRTWFLLDDVAQMLNTQTPLTDDDLNAVATIIYEADALLTAQREMSAAAEVSYEAEAALSASRELAATADIGYEVSADMDVVHPVDLSTVATVIYETDTSLTALREMSLTGTIIYRASIRLDVKAPSFDIPYEPVAQSRPDYQVLVIGIDDGLVKQIYGGVGLNLRYSRALNGIGSLVLTLDATDGIERIFPKDTLIEVERTHPVSRQLVVEETYLVRHTQRFRDDERDYFIVGGQSLNHLIKRRIIDPEDDPLQAGGFSTKDGPGHEVMRAYAREQMGDLASVKRRTPNLTIPEGGAGLTTVGARLRFENLLNVLVDLSKRSGCDFHIRRASGRALVMDIKPIGVDRTLETNYMRAPFVYLTPERGNLTAPSLEIDSRDEGTIVYAQSQGQGEARKLLKVQGPGYDDSIHNRIEFALDARTNERSDALALFGDAVDALNTNREKRVFTFEPVGTEPGNVYRQDWDVGDRVTVAWGEDFDLRITGIEIAVNEQGEDISITVEDVP